MKKKYIKPSIVVSTVIGETILLGESQEGFETGDFGAKQNTDFSWDDLDDDSNNTADNDKSSIWD